MVRDRIEVNDTDLLFLRFILLLYLSIIETVEVANEAEMEMTPSETIAVGPNKTQICVPDEK